jgi:type I restriction enzyme, R subunit
MTPAGSANSEFKLHKGHGFVDYMLFLDGKAIGVCEAKPGGISCDKRRGTGQEVCRRSPGGARRPAQTGSIRLHLHWRGNRLHQSLDPRSRIRRIFTFHRPETLREWLTADTLDVWLKQSGGFYTAADARKPSTLRARLRALPPVDLPGLWPNKVQAIASLEKSLFDDRPRALIQMATGTGKTLLAVTSVYRLIKFGGARRVLFLVDRANLGEQAEMSRAVSTKLLLRSQPTLPISRW